MKSFKELGITTNIESYIGDKIRIGKILNREVSVHKYKISPSKHNEGKCLHMQIQIGDSYHVVFTGSTMLMDTIKRIPELSFPFKTTIIQHDDRRLEFT